MFFRRVAGRSSWVMNVKKIFILVLLCGWSTLSSAEDIKMGEEYIEPLKYPKFSLGADYSFKPKVRELGKDNSTLEPKNEYTTLLSFEAGLYKYLNAGGMLFINIPPKDNPIRLRMSIFAKPYIPLGERFSLFARVGGGLGGWVAGDLPWASVNALTALGLEFFPFTRFGLSVEAGWRAEVVLNNNRREIFEAGPYDGPPKPSKREGARFFFAHEIPLALNLHIIL